MRREDYISDPQVVRLAKAAVKRELEKHEALDNPITVFDRSNNIVYKKNADGSKTIIGERIRKGRYSERIKKES